MNGNLGGWGRRELKLHARESFFSFLRPCVLCACLLLCFSLLGQIFAVLTGGTLFSLNLDIRQFPMQTGMWKADAVLMTNLMAMMGMEELGDLGGLVFALRNDAAGRVMIMPVAWRQLSRIAVIQAVILLVSVPLQYGVLAQFRRVLEGRPQSAKQLFRWYASPRLGLKALGVQILLELWRVLVSTLCALPGLLCALSDAVGLILLSPLFSLLGVLLGYGLYTALLPARYLLAQSPELTVGQAFSQGVRLLRGRRLDYFKLNLSFFPWILLSMLLWNLPDLFVIPYQELSNFLFLDPPAPPEAPSVSL